MKNPPVASPSPGFFSCPALTLALMAAVGVTPLVAGPTVEEMVPSAGAAVPALTSIKITFDEPVAGVDADDLVINAAAAAAVKGRGAGPYEFTFTQPIPGDVSVSWDFDHGIAGVSGSGAYAPEDGWRYQLIDTLPPRIDTVRAGQNLQAIVPLPGAEVTHLTQVEVRFNETVAGVDAGDLLVNDQPAASVSGEGAGPYTFVLADEPSPGSVHFAWDLDPGIVDPARNALEPHSWEVTLNPQAGGRLVITEFMAANASGLTDNDDDTADWLELFNAGGEPVSLAGWSLTSDPQRPDAWVIPSKTLAPGERLVIFASGKDSNSPFGKPHTNFTLDLSGGYLGLFSPESPREEISAFHDYPPQRIDFSYGLTPDGEKRYFPEPTPEKENPVTGLTELSTAPQASVSRGYFREPFVLVLSSPDPEASLHYTLDGSEPLTSSPIYAAPLTIDTTTVLRAAAFAPGKVPSETVTHSYLFLDETLTQPGPPYDNPQRDDDNHYPAAPSVGGHPLPLTFGSQNGAGFPGEIDNLPDNAAPADYGMDPEIIDDPNPYNDDGQVDPENGVTNRQRIERALRELPLLSVVMETADLFGEEGLHPNSLEKGTRYEFPCSVELLLPDGTTGFDTTCGIRMHGNASREPRKCPKHGFKLNFKSTFGASRLTYPLFPDSPSTEFDDLILRGDFNSSWLHWDGGQQRPRGTRMRDAFCKDTFRNMGRAAGHHRYVHLFLNGLYWGLYDITEQENNGFASNTFGGSKDDYDVVEQGQLKSGSISAYNTLRSLPTSVDDSEYEEIKEVLDIPWLADYMLLHFFLGHQDWGDNVDKNWYAVRHRDNGQFRYLPWDMENLMWDEDVDRVNVSSPPTGLHTKLTSHPEYRMLFADRVQKHLLTPDGALRPEKNIARWDRWRQVVQDAIACEAARWGDYRRDVHRHQSGPFPLFTWTDQWITEQNRLTETWFPKRPDIVVKQLRSADLYPNTQAPQLRDADSSDLLGSQHVPAGFAVKIVKASVFAGGDLYYTVDGADPRVAFDTTGARTPTAQRYSQPIVLDRSTVIRARALQGTEWSALVEATFTVGSPASAIRISEIHYNAKGSLGGSAAEFIEIHNGGDLEVDLGKWSIQGVEWVFPWGTRIGPGARLVVASNDAPSIFHAHHPGVTVVGYYGGRLDNDGERLALLDAQGHLVTAVEFDDDLPWDPQPDNEGPSLELLRHGDDPRSPFHWAASLEPNGSPGLPNSVESLTPSLQFSEVFVGEGGAQSFVELENLSPQTLSLADWEVAADNQPGQAVILASDTLLEPQARLTVSLSLPVAWGEIALRDREGLQRAGIRYGPSAPDLSFQFSSSQWNLGAPTPGSGPELAETAPLSALRINEWLADPEPGFDDWLELVNTADAPVLLTGLHVRVEGEIYPLTSPAAMAPGGFLRLYADRRGRRADSLLLQLPAAGATIALLDPAGREIDALTYSRQIQGRSQGRFPDGEGPVVTLDHPSPGLANTLVENAPLRLSEVLLLPQGWLELEALEPINLHRWTLRTVSARPKSWELPAQDLTAGGFTVITLGAQNQDPLDSGLPLDASYQHWGVELLNPQGHIVDRITWGRQIAGFSVGRTQEDEESWALLSAPTPGSPNASDTALGSVQGLRLNEWFSPGAGDASPQTAFLELFNPDPLPVNLSGLWLGDEPSERGRQKWQIPSLTFVAGQGYAVFQPAGEPSQPTRLSFEIARRGEYLRLGVGTDGSQQVDAVSFGRRTDPDRTRGRFPDGAETLQLLWPSPGAPNHTDAPGGGYDAWAAEHSITDPRGDDDGDGLLNFLEFLSGTDPHALPSSAERSSTQTLVHLQPGPEGPILSLELSVDPDVHYSRLLGETSSDLQSPWSPLLPSRTESLGSTPIQTERLRLEFALPSDLPVHFLRLRLEP